MKCEDCKWWDSYSGILDEKGSYREGFMFGKKVKYVVKRGECERFPKHERTLSEHYCGEFQEKPCTHHTTQ